MRMTKELTVVAKQIIAADGGANRIYDLHQQSLLESSIVSGCISVPTQLLPSSKISSNRNS